MSSFLAAFKRLLKIEQLDEDDEKDLEQDLQAYINSSKYADSNSDTGALEKLFMALEVNGKSGNNSGAESEQVAQSVLVDTSKPNEPEDGKVKGSQIYGGEFALKFADRLTSHLKLLDELEGEDSSILPGQPVYQPAKFGKLNGTQFNLRAFPIPNLIYNAMANNNLKMLGIMEQLTLDSYVHKFQTLLWVEEAHQAIEMRRYDLNGILLAKFDNSFFLLQVPGLAEGRPSLMRGDKIVLKSDKRSSYYEGYIHDVRERDVLVKLHASLHGSSMDGLRFDVSFMTSRTPFRRCHHGVFQVKQDSRLEQVVFPVANQPDKVVKPIIDMKESNHEELRCFSDWLNVYQRRAVINVLRGECRPAPYIIFGPPGTGKTVTMVEAILQVYARKRGSKILVCGNSNACADILAERIQESGVVPKDQMVRVSAFYRMEKLVPPHLEEITKDMDMISADMFAKYRVVITTCIQSGVLYEFKNKFDYVFIDEAGHANEPEALISIGLLKNDGCVVLAGDPHQLGPVCISKVAGEYGLGFSLLERLSRRVIYSRQLRNHKMAYDGRYITKLIICYRSDPRVLAVNNELFYANELEFKNKTPKKWMDILNLSHPLVFHCVKGRDRREYLNPSWFNPNEAIACLGYVNRLYGAGLKPDQLGIITPYRRQIDKLKVLFESCSLRQCKIATMEEFQGDEREVIIISTVRTREKNIKYDQQFKLGFLFDPKRFNVGTSRAKWLVIVVGDPAILRRDDCWVRYINKAQIIDGHLDYHKEPQVSEVPVQEISAVA